jgi:hypothetical protein
MRLEGVGQGRPRHMLLIMVGVLITATAVLRVVRVPVPEFRHPPYLGSMSEQWLAEHRAEHS